MLIQVGMYSGRCLRVSSVGTAQDGDLSDLSDLRWYAYHELV